MTVAVITLAIALVGAMGVIVWLVRRGDSRVDQVLLKTEELSSAKLEIGVKTMIAERALFEKEKAEQALVIERARANALEEYISADAQTKDPNADLAPDDVDGRMLRFSQRWAAASAKVSGTGNQVPAGTTSEVHPEKGTTASGTITVP